jgi:hypothetical protein
MSEETPEKKPLLVRATSTHLDTARNAIQVTKKLLLESRYEYYGEFSLKEIWSIPCYDSDDREFKRESEYKNKYTINNSYIIKIVEDESSQYKSINFWDIITGELFGCIEFGKRGWVDFIATKTGSLVVYERYGNLIEKYRFSLEDGFSYKRDCSLKAEFVVRGIRYDESEDFLIIDSRGDSKKILNHNNLTMHGEFNYKMEGDVIYKTYIKSGYIAIHLQSKINSRGEKIEASLIQMYDIKNARLVSESDSLKLLDKIITKTDYSSISGMSIRYGRNEEPYNSITEWQLFINEMNVVAKIETSDHQKWQLTIRHKESGDLVGNTILPFKFFGINKSHHEFFEIVYHREGKVLVILYGLQRQILFIEPKTFKVLGNHNLGVHWSRLKFHLDDANIIYSDFYRNEGCVKKLAITFNNVSNQPITKP